MSDTKQGQVLAKFEVIAEGNKYPQPPMCKGPAMTYASSLLRKLPSVTIRRITPMPISIQQQKEAK